METTTTGYLRIVIYFPTIKLAARNTSDNANSQRAWWEGSRVRCGVGSLARSRAGSQFLSIENIPCVPGRRGFCQNRYLQDIFGSSRGSPWAKPADCLGCPNYTTEAAINCKGFKIFAALSRELVTRTHVLPIVFWKLRPWSSSRGYPPKSNLPSLVYSELAGSTSTFNCSSYQTHLQRQANNLKPIVTIDVTL